MIEIEVNGDALGAREAGGGVPAAITRESRQQVSDLTHLADSLIDGQREKQKNPFYRVSYTYSTTLALPQPVYKRQLRSLDGGGTFTGDY
jgi:hypothetical protein